MRRMVLLLMLCGCASFKAYQQRQWAKIPDGVKEYCDMRAEYWRHKTGKSTMALIVCDDDNRYKCECVIQIYDKFSPIERGW